jgi:hypothetical protein
MLMKVLLKCADIGNVARPFEASRDRAVLLAAEFEALGVFQKTHGLAVDKLYVDTSSRLGGMSSGFISYVALPIFEALQDWMPSGRSIAGRVRANEMLWRRIQREEEEQEKREAAQKILVEAEQLRSGAGGLGMGPPPLGVRGE